AGHVRSDGRARRCTGLVRGGRGAGRRRRSDGGGGVGVRRRRWLVTRADGDGSNAADTDSRGGDRRRELGAGEAGQHGGSPLGGRGQGGDLSGTEAHHRCVETAQLTLGRGRGQQRGQPLDGGIVIG